MNEMNEKGDGPGNGLENGAFNLVIVGGGRACKFFLEFMHNEQLYSEVRVVGVCDINPDAVGLCLAREMGIYTTDNYTDLFGLKNVYGVVELTGSREVLLELIRHKPRGMGILEHNISRMLRDLLVTHQRLRSAEQQIVVEKMTSDFLIQQANERIVVLKPDFTIIDANDAYLEAVTKFEHEVVGMHCYEVTHHLDAPCSLAQPGLECPLIITLKTGESAQVIHEHEISKDHVIYCDMVTYPVKDQSGEIIRVIEVWRDITEELSSRWDRRARDLKADLKKLVQEDRLMSLGKLVASSVHEVNNPIQGLLTFSHLMKEILDKGEPDAKEVDEFRGYLSLMATELERCGEIISGLLSFSRASSKDFTHVDLNEILRQVLSLTRHRMELQDIQLSTELCPNSLLIYGDSGQLQQCFLNLIFNAIEAMPKGGELRVISKLDRASIRAEITLTDSGCGIEEGDLDHIFDPFFTRKEEGHGTGLGLSIVHGVIKAHKGDIKVKSKIGSGSSFVLRFPVEP